LDQTHGDEFSLGSFSIKDGSEIRLWEDKWLGNAILREQYPALYSIVHHKGDTIAKVMETSPPNVLLEEICLAKGLFLGMPYFIVWQISSCNLDTMNSVGACKNVASFQWLLCTMLFLPDVPIDSISNNKLWKLKIPLHIKVFGWYLRK
jgi:hypothetical protein